MKAVIYARVSTEEQDADNQVDAVYEMGHCRGFQITKVYKESGSAWKNGHQPELARLLADAERGRFQYVLVWSLDRLSREGPLAVLKFIDRLKRCNVRLISYQETWTNAPGDIGDLLYAIAAWVARMESERRSERTKAGMARSKALGQHIGRPKGSKDRKKRKQKVDRFVQ